MTGRTRLWVYSGVAVGLMVLYWAGCVYTAHRVEVMGKALFGGADEVTVYASFLGDSQSSRHLVTLDEAEAIGAWGEAFGLKWRRRNYKRAVRVYLLESRQGKDVRTLKIHQRVGGQLYLWNDSGAWVLSDRAREHLMTIMEQNQVDVDKVFDELIAEKMRDR